MPRFEKVIIVTRKTVLEELVERYNTRDQARFHVGQMAQLRPGAGGGVTAKAAKQDTPVAGDFTAYEQAHETYQRALATVRDSLLNRARYQVIERSFLPNFVFGENDLVVTLGQDGLVVNTAKYLNQQPLVAFNPDPEHIDGVLIPFYASAAALVLRRVLEGRVASKQIRMAKAELNDGQSLYAVNDLFIGQKTHQSARYRLELDEQGEDQSSSGIIISTGAGSTGWFRSILTGAAETVLTMTGLEGARAARDAYRFDWEADYLRFSVREPFVSRTTGATLISGVITTDQRMEIISQMPQNGVIFSDGIEEDYLAFNSGAIASVRLAEKRVNLVTNV
ncbi:MAG: sugar kinase [Chthonomonadales bacterium]|nr:sugar kinase [Chthonomonadales bacterium]